MGGKLGAVPFFMEKRRFLHKSMDTAIYRILVPDRIMFFAPGYRSGRSDSGRFDGAKIMKKTIFYITTLWFFAAPQLRAEGALMQTEPAANSEISAFGGKVKAWFSGNVSERAPSLLVVDGKGVRVDNRDIELRLGPRSELSVTTSSLPTGTYAVRYRVLTVDGLVVSGIFRFSVKS